MLITYGLVRFREGVNKDGGAFDDQVLDGPVLVVCLHALQRG